jgi:molybdopterin-binding protein
VSYACKPIYSARMIETYRIGEAAELLGVRIETLRRWELDGKLKVRRTSGGQRLVPAAEVARLLAERRGLRPIGSASQRNRFAGVITEVKKDGLAATVEIQAGPNRILAFITREAADEMRLKPGMQAVAAVKATNFTIELPG